MAVQSMMDTLLNLREGAAICEASEKLTALIDAVRNTGKVGSITIQLIVKPASKGKITVIAIEDKITEKLPEYDKELSIFYASDENLLTKSDPRQMPLEGLRVVEEKPTKLREAI